MVALDTLSIPSCEAPTSDLAQSQDQDDKQRMFSPFSKLSHRPDARPHLAKRLFIDGTAVGCLKFCASQKME